MLVLPRQSRFVNLENSTICLVQYYLYQYSCTVEHILDSLDYTYPACLPHYNFICTTGRAYLHNSIGRTYLHCLSQSCLPQAYTLVVPSLNSDVGGAFLEHRMWLTPFCLNHSYRSCLPRSRVLVAPSSTTSVGHSRLRGTLSPACYKPVVQVVPSRFVPPDRNFLSHATGRARLRQNLCVAASLRCRS